MEMMLMGAVLAMFGLAVSCLAFGAATRDDRAEQKEVMKAAGVEDAKFFPDAPVLPVAAARPRVPLEVLLLQIENHVRLEQAAAECFVQAPNSTRLHSRTISTLVN